MEPAKKRQKFTVVRKQESEMEINPIEFPFVFKTQEDKEYFDNVVAKTKRTYEAIYINKIAPNLSSNHQIAYHMLYWILKDNIQDAKSFVKKLEIIPRIFLQSIEIKRYTNEIGIYPQFDNCNMAY